MDLNPTRSKDSQSILVDGCEFIDHFSAHELCLRESLCPRGHGPLEICDSRIRRCPQCGFTHASTTGPYYERRTFLSDAEGLD